MPKWREDNQKQFLACLAGLECNSAVLEMRDIQQHAPGVTCYDHSMCVAYFSFLICRKMGLDYRAAARAGLLHDLYLQHWEGTDVGLMKRLTTHPTMALQNAQAFGLSEMEADIISKHMWPLTPELPSYRESFVVSMADKVSASLEMVRLYRLLGFGRNVRALRLAHTQTHS